MDFARVVPPGRVAFRHSGCRYCPRGPAFYYQAAPLALASACYSLAFALFQAALLFCFIIRLFAVCWIRASRAASRLRYAIIRLSRHYLHFRRIIRFQYLPGASIHCFAIPPAARRDAYR